MMMMMMMMTFGHLVCEICWRIDQGRLNQWAHCGEIIFKTNYLTTFAKINCGPKGNPVNTF